MLAHRLRLWPNIEQTLFQCVVFAVEVLNVGKHVTKKLVWQTGVVEPMVN